MIYDSGATLNCRGEDDLPGYELEPSDHPDIVGPAGESIAIVGKATVEFRDRQINTIGTGEFTAAK